MPPSLVDYIPLPWRPIICQPQLLPSLHHLQDALNAFALQGGHFLPAPQCIFRALELTPPQNVKVLILGQDPYPNPNCATGLAFSVPSSTPLPPSLRNIYAELESDLQCPPPTNGNLEPWSAQGVLLLNTSLTVQAGRPASHSQLGWQNITTPIVAYLGQHVRPLVAILWGRYAQAYAPYLQGNHTLILAAPHPSPLSAHRGFFGSKPFSRTNDFLAAHGQKNILWSPYMHNNQP